MKLFSSINPFKRLKPKQMVDDTLFEYQRQYLVYAEEAAYNQKMAEFYKDGITRLSNTSHAPINTVN